METPVIVATFEDGPMKGKAWPYYAYDGKIRQELRFSRTLAPVAHPDSEGTVTIIESEEFCYVPANGGIFEASAGNSVKSVKYELRSWSRV